MLWILQASSFRLSVDGAVALGIIFCKYKFLHVCCGLRSLAAPIEQLVCQPRNLANKVCL